MRASKTASHLAFKASDDAFRLVELTFSVIKNVQIMWNARKNAYDVSKKAFEDATKYAGVKFSRCYLKSLSLSLRTTHSFHNIYHIFY
jgi:hypothetical protein